MITERPISMWAAALTTAALVLSGGATAHPRDGQKPGFHSAGHADAFVAHLTQTLALTEDQSAKVREIVGRYFGGALGDRESAMRDSQKKLQAVVHDPSATDAQVRDAAQAVGSDASGLAVERHHMALEIGAVLTAEQRQKAADLMQEGQPMRPRSAIPREGPDGF